MMGGHNPDAVFWFDDDNFGWTSGEYYFPDGTLPDWVEEINASLRDRIGQTLSWEVRALETSDAESDEGSTASTTIGERRSLGTPFGAELTIQMALSAVVHYGLGSGGRTDLLFVGLSGRDYLDPRLGATGREMEELTMAEDSALARLFNELDRVVNGGLKTMAIVLTADRGAAPAPESLRRRGIETEPLDAEALLGALNEHLDQTLGPPGEDGPWAMAQHSLNFYLNHRAIRAAGREREAVEEEVKRFLASRREILTAFSATDVRLRRLPPGPLERQILRSYFPGRSGDVVAVMRPYHTTSAGASAGETGYAYNATVPILLYGTGIRGGDYAFPAEVVDIAATLAFLIGVAPPAMSEGRVLHEIIDTSEMASYQ